MAFDPANPNQKRLPVLDGSNYAYWKIRLRSHIKSIDVRAWRSVTNGYSLPMLLPDEDGDVQIKPESEWTNEEVSQANFNEKALNAIFEWVDMHIFKLIQNSSTAKEAWDILQRFCEGDGSVRENKLRGLTSKFERLRMGENETISSYFEKLFDIANECQVLGEPFTNKQLVSKAIRTLPERFNMKVSSIEEAHNLSTLDINSLMSILKNFESNLLEQSEATKPKNIALNVQSSSCSNDDEIFEELDENASVALIARKYNAMVKKMNTEKLQVKAKEQQTKVHSLMPKGTHPSTQKSNPMRRASSDQSRSDPKHIESIQCHACSGWGHYANECANTLRKRGKNLWVSLSDNEDEDPVPEEEPDQTTMFVQVSDSDTEYVTTDVTPTAITSETTSVRYENFSFDNEFCFMVSTNSDAGSSQEDELSKDEIISSLKELYEDLLKEWKKEYRLVRHLTKMNDGLRDDLTKLEIQVSKKEAELERVMSKLTLAEATLKKLNTGSSKLDEILNLGKPLKAGIGFQESLDRITSSLSCDNHDVCFVKERTCEKNSLSKNSSDMVKVCKSCCTTGLSKIKSHDVCKSQSSSCVLPEVSSSTSDNTLCQMQSTLCMLPEVPPSTSDNIQNQRIKNAEKKWKPKSKLRCDVVYTALKTNVEGSWYFDSGCSRHMTGTKSFLKNYESIQGGSVTYGGGGKSNIIGKGSLNVPGFPSLKNVLHVDGLVANLISISQLCDDNLEVKFNKSTCEVFDHTNKCVMTGTRSSDNCYRVEDKVVCNTAKVDVTTLWHQKLGHVHFRNIDKIVKLDAVLGVPKLDLKNHIVCEACLKGKQTRAAHSAAQHSEQHFGTTHCFQLLHMDLMGPVEVESFGGKKYSYVIVDDFSRFTWVYFLKEKSETFEKFKLLHAKIKNMFCASIFRIRSDHGKEFDNVLFTSFCERKGIHHEFSAPKTPQQNGVAERKNRTLLEMTRVMLFSKNISKRFWAEALSTACHTANRVFLRPGTTMTPYEILNGRKPKVHYFHVFGCVCYILNDRDYLAKFDSKSDRAIFLGYASNSRAYRVYNLRLKTIQESMNIVFDDLSSISGDNQETPLALLEDVEQKESANPDVTNDVTTSEVTSGDTATQVASDSSTADGEEEAELDAEVHENIRRDPPPSISRNHPTTQVIGEVNEGVRTRTKQPISYRDMVRYVCMSTTYNKVQSSCFVSSIEPSNVKEALKDNFWIQAMQEELDQFARNEVWSLVPRPHNTNVIGTKWIFKNKTDEQGNIVRNKARLVAQGYTQVEGIDFDETFAPVARIESIRLLLAIACYLNITLYQMDVKAAFLNGYLQEEVFVEQPKGFEDPHNPNHVYKLDKALYGLKQAPRAWYGRLTSFLLDYGFTRGEADRTLFILMNGKERIIVQIYVDDIVYGSTSKNLLNKFVEAMTSTFEMSMIGELNFFLGLQVKQSSEGIFVSQSKYARSLVKKFGLEGSKCSKIPMGTTLKLGKDQGGEDVDPTLYRSMIGSLLYLTSSRPDIMFSVCVCARYQSNPKVSHLNAVKKIIKYVAGTCELGIWFSKDTNTNLVGFSDSDWAGDMDDRKSTSGGCFYLGNNLVSWFSRKQNCVSLSTAESEYVAAGSCCSQLIWLKHMLDDYGLDSNILTMFCDNLSAINISKNPVQHSRTKHIDIRHHFLRDMVEKGLITIEHVDTKLQLADIFTKALDYERFSNLKSSLGLCTL